MDQQTLVKAKRHLSRNDAVMAKLIKSFQPYSLEAIGKKRRGSHFHALVSTIINQQLSVKAADTIAGRLLSQQGGKFFSAAKLASLSCSTFRACGISQSKTRYILAAAQACTTKQLNFSTLSRMSDRDAIEVLLSLPGIGPWSAQMFMMASMERQDILPLGDLVLRKSMQYHYSLSDQAVEDNYHHIADLWRPYRSIASRYLWSAAP